MAAEIEKCHKCDRAIGRMDQAYLWQEQVVYAQCHAGRSRPVPRQAAAVADETMADTCSTSPTMSSSSLPC